MAVIDNINNTTKNISELYSKLKSGEIFIDNSFQRRYVWEEKHQIALIETILLGYDIPAIYFWEQVPNDDGVIKVSVVDGQQRLGAIKNYIDGSFALKKSYLIDKNFKSWAGKRFDELSKEEKNKIWSYCFGIKSIKSSVTFDEIKTLFLRLNITNKVLNPQELRNAKYDGKFLSLAMELANNSFWKNHNIFSSNDIRRMADVELVSNLLVFLRLGFKVPLGQKSLNKVYDLYNNEYYEAKEDKAVFLNIIESIDRLFGYCNNKDICKPTHIYTLFAVFYRLKYGNYNQSESQYFEAIKNFYTLYSNQEESTEEINEYRAASMEAVKSQKNRDIRYNAIIDFINSNV